MPLIITILILWTKLFNVQLKRRVKKRKGGEKKMERRKKHVNVMNSTGDCRPVDK